MKTILIVEDDPVIREELALLLANEGCRAEAVTDFTGVAGQVLELEPDLVLLDLGLPGRDGLAICADIRRSSAIPIIVVTSRATQLDELMSMNLGADDFLTKPYNT